MDSKAKTGFILDVLPTELTVGIFRSCLPTSRFIQPRTEDAPMLLGQVCRQWRNIALTTPELWSSLRIPDHGKPDELTRIHALVEMWLSRSGDCPFSFWCPYAPFEYGAIYGLLIKTCHRWKDIRLEMLPQTPPLPPQSKFPLLESLELLTPMGLPSPNPFDSVNPFGSSPCLRKLVWIDPKRVEYAGNLSFRWDQLTNLTLYVEISLLACLRILSKSNNLVQAAFQNINMRCSNDANPNLAPKSIDLPNLETLSLLMTTSFEPLFQRMTCPKLSELLINLLHGRENWEWPISTFLSFLERSQCPIATLSLYFNNIPTSDLISILRPIQSSLKALTLQGPRSPFTSEIATLLTNTDSRRPCFCPNLEFIGLFDCICVSERCPDGLSALIQSRSKDPTAAPGDPTYVARLKVVECFEKDAPIFTKGLTDGSCTPILLRYDQGSILAASLTPKESTKLEKLKDEGLCLPKYSAVTGQLGRIDDWYV